MLHLDGCPNAQVLRERLADAARLAGVELAVSATEVSPYEEAELLGFRGSPTLLVEDVDPFADEWLPVGLSCRLHATPAGTGGSPSVEQLVVALTAG